MLPSTAEPLNESEGKRSIRNVQTNNSKCGDICLTPGCISAAVSIQKDMNSDVQPCDNFYKFACDNFLNFTIIPVNKASVSARGSIEDIVIEQLRTILEKESSPNEPRPYRLAKDFYKSCMNDRIKKTASLKLELQPLLDNLKKLGGWPVLEGDNWKESNFNLTDSVYKFHELGYPVDYFIKFKVIDKDSGQEIYLYPPTVILPQDYVVTEGMNSGGVRKHHKYMVDVAEILGADRSRATAEMEEIVQFEFMLVNISNMTEQNYNYYKYDKINLNQLSTDYPSIPWLEYLNAILTPQVRLNNNNTVYITSAYLRDLEVLMSRTPKKVQANYILWRAVDKSDESRTIKDILYLYEERIPKWLECVHLVSELLDLSVASMYLNEYAGKNELEKMINDIRNEFKKILEKAEWMDQKTTENALEKLASMKSYIIYPDEFLNIKKLDEFYEKLELNTDDFEEDQLNAEDFVRNNKMDEDEWWKSYSTLTQAGAYYITERNTFIIPAAYMQGIFFSNDRTSNMNYGTIGSIIGHEITHAFSYSFGHYDKTDEEVDWWEPETKKKFVNRTQCLIDQYGNYRAGIHELNGTRTLNENIADNAGVKAAYYAYKEWAKTNGRGQKLPGLPYTPEQIFWISFANSWCTKYKPEKLLHDVQSATHSPPEFRVNGALSNMEEFSQDFDCKIGLGMNPVKKCDIF